MTAWLGMLHRCMDCMAIRGQVMLYAITFLFILVVIGGPLCFRVFFVSASSDEGMADQGF